MVKAISAVLPEIQAKSGEIMQCLIDGCLNANQKMIETVLPIIQGLVQGVLQYLPEIVISGVEILQNLINGIIILSTLVDNLANAVTEILTSLIDGIITILPMLIDCEINILDALILAIICRKFLMRQFRLFLQLPTESLKISKKLSIRFTRLLKKF